MTSIQDENEIESLMYSKYNNFDLIYEDEEDKEKKVYDTRRIDILQDNNTFFLRQIIRNNALTLNVFAREDHDHATSKPVVTIKLLPTADDKILNETSVSWSSTIVENGSIWKQKF